MCMTLNVLKMWEPSKRFRKLPTQDNYTQVTWGCTRVAKTLHVHEQKGQGFGGAPPVSQRRSGAENTDGVNRDGSPRSPLHNYQVLESETLTEHGHSLGKSRRNIEEAEQDKETWELKRK